LQTVLHQRERHNKFEQLATSDVVKEAQKSWSLRLSYTPEKAIETFRRLPENQQRDVFGGLAQEERVDLLAKLKCEPLLSGDPSTAATLKNLSQVDPFAQYQDPWAVVSVTPSVPGNPHDKPVKLPKRSTSVVPKYTIEDAPAKDDPYACIAEPIDPPTSTVNKSDIKTTFA
jgi:hypothetical protein